MRYRRMPIEVESPEETGYDSIRCNLAESSIRDRVLGDLALDIDLRKTILLYGDHRGHPPSGRSWLPKGSVARTRSC